MKKGRFIVFEGIDGSGKSTQASILAHRLNSLANESGHYCTLEEEPDSREILGGLIRSALHGGYKISKDVLAYLYAANRIEHINRIKPIIDDGNHIVCDRFFFSNMAYNQTEHLDMNRLYELNKPFVSELKPDAVVFVKVSPEEAAKRRADSRWDEEIFDKLEKQREIADNYEKVFDLLKNEYRIVEVDGSLDIDELSKLIWRKLGTELELF